MTQPGLPLRRPLPPRPIRQMQSGAVPAPLRAVPSRGQPPALPASRALPAAPTRGHPRSRPDPASHRLAIGFGGIAAASALATAFLGPAQAATPMAAPAPVTADAGLIQRDIRYVQLLPGQTPPPNATVAQAPAATPRVVVVTTRQSGTKR